MNIYYTNYLSPLGNIFIAATLKGICRISFGEMEESIFKSEMDKKNSISLKREDKKFNEIYDGFERYFKGKPVNFDYEIDLIEGTLFQKEVWKKLRLIPYGECRSYHWLANMISKPNHCRAVGVANSKNPILIIIPCHRVIYKNGNIGGYSSGVWIKESLLKIEGLTLTK